MSNFRLVSVCLFMIIGAWQVQAKVIAVASKVTGNAFYMSGSNTQMIKVGTHIPANAQIFTELGASLSINDYYDHLYHLSGSSHLVLHQRNAVLKAGYLWVQTRRYHPEFGELVIATPNAKASFKEGEGIISFDSSLGKTQLLAVKGNFMLKNFLEEYKVSEVEEGTFSFVDEKHDAGRPRQPTSVGYDSYQKITGLFNNISPLTGRRGQGNGYEKAPKREMSRSARTIASFGGESNFERALAGKKPLTPSPEVIQEQVEVQAREVAKVPTAPPVVRQEVPVVRDHLVVDRHKLIERYKTDLNIAKPKKTIKKTKKRWKPSYSKKSNVKVRVFGQAPKRSKKTVYGAKKPVKRKATTSRRMPASVSVPVEAYRPAQGTKKTKEKTAFESKLIEEYGKQMRHERELNSLIDELKSVDADYNKNY